MNPGTTGIRFTGCFNCQFYIDSQQVERLFHEDFFPRSLQRLAAE
jgi:hypothetical protein